MSYDYTNLRKKAENLVTKFGRTVTLIRPSEINKNDDRPWKGPKELPDEEGAPLRLIVPGVQLLPNQVRTFGLSALGEAGKLEDLIQISELVYVVFQGETDMRQFTFVEDDGINYHINTTQSLKPANVTLLGFIGVRR